MSNTEQYSQYFGLEVLSIYHAPLWGSPLPGFGLQLSSERTQVKRATWNL